MDKQLTIEEEVEQHFDKYKHAFDLIQSLCEGYKVSIEISYGVRKTVSKFNRKWVVKTMGKIFVDTDPLKAIADAFKLILAAHGRNDLLPQDNQS